MSVLSFIEITQISLTVLDFSITTEMKAMSF